MTLKPLLLAAVCAGLVACTGKTGPEGLLGPSGPSGPSGPQGPRGEVGLTGQQGSPGEPGISVLSASLAVGASDCPHGGSQFTSVMGTTFACNGADGIPGAAGAVGPQGPAGPAGTPGSPGATGPQGASGPMGPAAPITYRTSCVTGTAFFGSYPASSWTCTPADCAAGSIDLGLGTVTVASMVQQSGTVNCSAETGVVERTCMIDPATAPRGPLVSLRCGWSGATPGSCVPPACPADFTDLGVSDVSTFVHVSYNSCPVTFAGYSYRNCLR